MGSLLNFVFLKDTHEYNGDETYAMCGPIFYYIVKNEFTDDKDAIESIRELIDLPPEQTLQILY